MTAQGDGPRYGREHLRHVIGYVPGVQPEPSAIKLNTNENPYPPSPAVLAALTDISVRSLQRYPDPTAAGFRECAARLHDLQANQIIATNGGDELLRLAITTFVDPGRAIGIVTPSYGVYSVLAEIHQAPLSRAPLMDDWILATDTSTRWNDAGAQLAILTNPHAPTGALFSLDAIERLAASFSGVLLIDEAYIDFVDPSRRYNAAELIARHSNILLLRTLSKGYSLAGIRMAYGMANAALIEPMLGKTKDSYNVDAIAQRLGTAAIEDRAYARSTWDRVREERARLTEGLEALGFAVAPSEANFVLASVPSAAGASNARAMKDGLEARGIYVRWFDEDRLRDRLRISIGTGAENTAVLRLLGEMVHERGAGRST